jgi:hypothetical protein
MMPWWPAQLWTVFSITPLSSTSKATASACVKSAKPVYFPSKTNKTTVVTKNQ